MKRIYLNLKRFDVPADSGGVNRIAAIAAWGAHIVDRTQDALRAYPEAEFTVFFPEAHLIPAAAALSVAALSTAARSAAPSSAAALSPASVLRLGCQGVYREDTSPGGNFGAFTTNMPASAAKALGCRAALIGHFEERKDLNGILAEAGVADERGAVGAGGAAAAAAVNRILNKEIKCAQTRDMDVLYCIGESADEQPRWEEILGAQLDIGLEGVDMQRTTIAYEPVWSIGPGKTPAGKDYIEKIARFIKARFADKGLGDVPVVYGGGLKTDNAAMLASIPEIDGGLIALTRFSGEIGFYPEEYLQIVQTYLGAREGRK